MGLLSMQQQHPHQQQGTITSHHTQSQPHHPQQHGLYSRPSSVVHQQSTGPPAQQRSHSQSSSGQQQHHASYQQPHAISSVYQQAGNQAASQQSPDGLSYYTHSPYSTPGATGGYPSADTSEMMAAAQMPRHPYPPMQYHTPQSNSPASVASPSQHDQHRGLYGQAPTQQLPQSMYYQTQQAQYQSMPSQAQSSYAHAQHAAAQHQAHPNMNSHHQMMTSQPAMSMAQTAAHNPLAQHQHQHQQQHQQQHPPSMSNSPRPKMEPGQTPLQLQKPLPQQQGMGQQGMGVQQQQQQQQQAGGHGGQNSGTGNAPLSTPTSATGVNPNAAPGPIPATTPLVVRQDNNGVQWIAFEYSRDRVKMEYTIRCDVESVNTDELTPEFKTENCVYPRACCPKEQYRGNRQVYETECNTVGWALAQLNQPLRGKRGLIQRAVDSWRNSNQDPRLRSRRVRRMAKMNNRKAMQPTSSQSPHLAGHPSMGPGGPAGMGKPPMGMGQAMHHQGHDHGSGAEVGEMSLDTSAHHHHQANQPDSNTEDVRPAHVFQSGYGGGSSMSQQLHQGASVIATSGGGSGGGGRRAGSRPKEEPEDDSTAPDLFPDIPDAKKRKFILVEDNVRGSRLRVRVTLEGVNTKEIPDSFRKGSSVYPRSYFPREMQSPPPSPTGRRFFDDDLAGAGADDDGVDDTNGREISRRRGRASATAAAERERETISVRVPVAGEEGGGAMVVGMPRMRRAMRGKEVRLNELGYRMAWLQSRVFAGRTVFLQRALDCYRNKSRSAIESMMQDVQNVAPHYETRVGKRRWTERMRSKERKDD